MLKLAGIVTLQFLLVSFAFANYASYMQEKEAYRAEDEGGEVINPYWGANFDVAPENADPAYDSTVDEDMLFDSYHMNN